MLEKSPRQDDEQPAPHSTAENRVWQAVLIRAIFDLYEVQAAPYQPERARRDAELFLADDERLAVVCAAAKVDLRWFRRRLRDPALRERLRKRLFKNYVLRKNGRVADATLRSL